MEIINIFLVIQVSGLVRNFNIEIFSETIKVITVEEFMINCSWHFQWSWPHFKVTAVSNNFYSKFYVPIRLNWNFIGLFSTSSRAKPWSAEDMLDGQHQRVDIPSVLCRVSICGKNSNAAVFSDTLNMINVKLCLMVVLFELYPFIPVSLTLIVFQDYSSVKHL